MATESPPGWEEMEISLQGASRACKPVTVGRPEQRYASWTFPALGPLSPASASYETFAPSASER